MLLTKLPELAKYGDSPCESRIIGSVILGFLPRRDGRRGREIELSRRARKGPFAERPAVSIWPQRENLLVYLLV